MIPLLQQITEASSTSLRAVLLTELYIQTGRIVACDPLISHDKAFELTVPQGSYPVIAWWHKEEERIAAVQLKLTDVKPVRWEMAMRPGQNVADLKEGYSYGYPVDTGLGCFADERAIHLMNEMETNLANELGEEFISFYDDAVADILAEHNDDWGSLIVEKPTGLNVVMFSSGYGDGFYTSYWGFDEHGKLTSLVTDFNLL